MKKTQSAERCCTFCGHRLTSPVEFIEKQFNTPERSECEWRTPLAVHDSSFYQEARASPAHSVGGLLELKRQNDAVAAIPVLRAAEVLEIGRATVYRKIKTGEVKWVRRGTQKWPTVEWVANYIKQNCRPSQHSKKLRTLKSVSRVSVVSNEMRHSSLKKLQRRKA